MNSRFITFRTPPRQQGLSRRAVGHVRRRARSLRRRLVFERLELRELFALPPSYLGDLRVEFSVHNELTVDDTSKNDLRTVSAYTVPLLSNPSEIQLIPPGESIDAGGLITVDQRYLDDLGALAVAHGGYVGTADVVDNRFGLTSLQSLTRLDVQNSTSGPRTGFGAAFSQHRLRLTPLPNEQLPAGTPIEISVLALLDSIDRSACGLSACHGDTAGSQLEITASAEFVSPQGSKGFSFSRSAASAPRLYDLAAVNVETVVGTTASLEMFNMIRGPLVLPSERRGLEMSLSAIQARPLHDVALAGGEVRWRSYEEGGGIEYTYFVLDELPVNTAPRVDLFWATGEDRTRRVSGPVATLRLTADGRDADGKPMRELGMHRVVIRHEDFVPGLGSPRDFSGEFLHAELSDGATDRIVRKHVASAVPPLVVNVILHGWRPPTGGPWEEFAEQFRKIAAYYGGSDDQHEFEYGSGLARADSLLHHRVVSVAPIWESDTKFTSAFGAVAISKMYDAYAASANIVNSVSALLLAEQFRDLAERQSTGSRAIARAAAQRIAGELIGGPLLGDRDESNAIQRIQVIGHSRGAAVGAMVTEILAQRGYRNVVNFTSLDGFSTDWPDDAGIIGDTDIAATAVASEKFNYRVDLGLIQLGTEGVLNLFDPDSPMYFIVKSLLNTEGMLSYLQSLNLRAPERSGFWNSTLRKPDGAYTDHVTITPAFLDSAAACGAATYINLNWFGRRCGSAPAGEGEGGSRSGLSGTGEGDQGDASQLGNGRQIGPLIDGDFESVGALLRLLQSQRDALAGTDENLIAGYDFLLDPSMQLAATWEAKGSPTAVMDSTGTRAQLHDGDSLSQYMEYDKPLASIVVVGKVAKVNQGYLEVLLDDKLVRTISLSHSRGVIDETIRVGDGVKSDAKLEVRVRGPNGTDVEVELDSIAVRAHHSWHRFLDPTDVNGDGETNPLDALIVLNQIARSGVGPLRPLDVNTFVFDMYDVNDDGELAPIDALRVLNWLARQPRGVEGEGTQGGPTGSGWPFEGDDRLGPLVLSTVTKPERDDRVATRVFSQPLPSRFLAQRPHDESAEVATLDALMGATEAWQSESDDFGWSLAEADWDWISPRLPN
jgi:hypothetical protein